MTNKLREPFFLISLFLFTACAQRMRVPINRLKSPEVTGGGFRAEYQALSQSNAKISFSDGKNSLSLEQVEDTRIALGGGIGSFDVFYDLTQNTVGMFGIQAQFMGTPRLSGGEGSKASVFFSFGNDRDTVEDQYDMKVKTSAWEFGVLHGFRFSESFMLYDALSIGRYSFDGEILKPTGLKRNSVSYSTNKLFNLGLGLELSLLPYLIKLEYGYQVIKWSRSDMRTFHSLALSLGGVF